MAVFRVERNTGYTVMSNHHLRNKELTLKAKGLLSQMEEYIPFIKQFAYGEQKYNFTVAQKNFSVSYLPASEAEVVCIEIAEDVPYTISGNNIDGYIITEWR